MMTVERKREGCLTIFLIMMLVVNLVTGFYFLVTSFVARQSLPAFPAWIIPVSGLLCMANVVFTLAIWKWKKWGLYGFACSVAAAYIVNLVTTKMLWNVFGLIGVLLLAFLLRPHWSHMD